eukprot:jgi/Mesvir1/16967/Mv15815-RA.1
MAATILRCDATRPLRLIPSYIAKRSLSASTSGCLKKLVGNPFCNPLELPSVSSAPGVRLGASTRRLHGTVAMAFPTGVAASVAIAVVATTALALYRSFRAASPLPAITASATPFNRAILSRMPGLLHRPYVQTLGLTNGHVETILAAMFRSVPAVQYRRECLYDADGGCFTLDWPVYEGARAEGDTWHILDDTTPIFVLLPGLTGGSEDPYVRSLVRRCWQYGYRSVVFNSRGCAHSPVTTPQFYSASYTEDLRAVIKHVRKLYPNAMLMGAGWSLGANILVRYLGEEGSRTPLSLAISMCNPFDLVICDKKFQEGFNRIYDANLAKSLRGIYSSHHGLFEGIGGDFQPERARTCRSVREFDEAITRVSFGFATVDEYYAWSGSCHSIPNVRVPLLCLQAMDDPIACASAIPYAAIKANPYCMLATTPGGGHLGWCAGDGAPFGAPWPELICMEYVAAVQMAMLSGHVAWQEYSNFPGYSLQQPAAGSESPGSGAGQAVASMAKKDKTEKDQGDRDMDGATDGAVGTSSTLSA